MLIDAREVTRDSTLEADLCVIGGGAAGITIARELAGSGLDVLVLESGEFTADARQQELYDGEVVGLPLLRGTQIVDLKSARLRFFGGTTNHWAGWCRTLDPIDFEERDYLDLSGWPIDLDDLLPYYARAAEVIQLGPPEFGTEFWSEQGVGQPMPDTDAIRTEVLQVKGTFKFGEAYRAELEGAEDVRLCVWANATEIVTSDNGGRVTSVQVATLSGNEFTVEARAYVLATGGIDVPRLLLASNRVRPAGIGNENDLVGRYFAEHLHVPVGFAVLAVDDPVSTFYAGRTPVRFDQEGPPARVTVHPQGVLRLSDEVMRQEGLLGLEASFIEIPPQGGSQLIDGVDVDIEHVTNLLGAQVKGIATSLVFLAFQCEQALRPDSRVTLARETDELGMPKTQLDWRVGEIDRDSIRRGAAIMAQSLGQLGVGRFRVAPGEYPQLMLDAARVSDEARQLLEFEGDEFPVGIGFHHMCTTRMSTDPKTGVVDSDSKVHGVANLYVASAAAFATGGAVTPTMTITALALRLADHLRDDVLG